MDKYEEILKILIDKVSNVRFALVGSLGLKFQGVEIDAHDIDLLTDNEGIKKIAENYNSEILKNIEDKYLETKFYINDVEIHCVSNILNPLRTVNLLDNAILIEKNGINVLCMPLESELEFYKNLNREKDQGTIKLIEEKLKN